MGSQCREEEQVQDSHTDEVVVAILILLLVIYTFCHFIHVWSHTLNFSEVRMGWSIQPLDRVQNPITYQICDNPYTYHKCENVMIFTPLNAEYLIFY